MNLNNLISIASFTPSSLEFPPPWVGHIPFAAWVIQEVSPKIFVELGTHSGNSYFTFCQSVAQAGLSTKCYAVDTWQGDEHAGEYNDAIYSKVAIHNSKHYARFSALLRMKFDDAATYFDDESIELLHIDGLHTYEAVHHDFETWLPKLAPGAVVMFHDTNVRERNFGVWRLWEELQVRYPNNLEFTHSHGLGVLQIHNAIADDRLPWLKTKTKEKALLISYFSALGANQRERYDLIFSQSQIESLNHAAWESEARATNLNLAVQGKDVHIANLAQALQEKDVHINGLHQAVNERDGQIVNLNLAVQGKDVHIANLAQALQEKDVHINGLHQAVNERDGQIVNLNQTVDEHKQEIAIYIAESDKLTKAICESIVAMKN